MYELPAGCEAAFHTRRRNECLELRLVLDAAGIGAEVGYRDGWWLLVVRNEDLFVAGEEIDAYRKENPPGRRRRPVRVPTYGGAAVGVLAYTAVVIGTAILASQWAFGVEWLPAGRMQAGRIMAGEWWRTITALTLHLDAAHVTANLIFGGVFGLLAAHALGGGVAWLAILLGGALGNFMNALVQAPGHSAIGASTAVFSALGIIVAHALRYRGALRGGVLRRWSPLIGGILLLAYTGTGGERTDIVAHLTGFVAGLVIGWVGCRLPDEVLSRSKVQSWSAATAAALVALAWVFAVGFWAPASG